MRPGDFLVDASRDERRFRIKEFLYEGRSYQIALAEDTLMEDKLVCVKAIVYDEAKLGDKAYVASRRKALHQEMQFLALPAHLLPEPLDWIQLDGSDTSLEREPVLVYEYMHGETLFDHVVGKYPEGMAPARALRIVGELGRFLAEIHHEKWVFRDLDPRHVIISVDDVIHVVGCGNATPMGARPNVTKMVLNPCYAAPEIRDETSGQFLRGAADIYSLAALLTFLLTGVEPRERPENPLTRAAYDKLSALEPPGIALLIARCIQPLAKNRFARVERFLQFCDMAHLPTPQTKDFGLLQLPAPWAGAEPENRATASKLSAGPLISVARSQHQPDVVQNGDQPVQKAPTGCRAVLVRLGLASATLLVCASVIAFIAS